MTNPSYILNNRVEKWERFHNNTREKNLVALDTILKKFVIWPLVWLGTILFFKSGSQARWIYEKIQTPRSFYLAARNILNFHLGIPKIAGWISVTIEPVAACNLSCKYCARAKDKLWITPRPVFMDWDLFVRIIDEIPETVEAICLSGVGEPLMHPRVVDMIEYASKSGRRVYMFTNGTLLKGELLRQLAESPLDALNVSIEPDAESARYYRDVDYDEIAGNIRAYAAAKRKGQLVNVSLVMNEMHHKKIMRFATEWQGIVDHIKISPQIAFGSIDPDENAYVCSELWRGNMDIKTSGSISVCCFDPMEELVVGNVNTASLKSIIDSEAFTDLLRRMIDGDMPTLCKKCTAYCFTGKHISRTSRKKARGGDE